MEVSCQLHDPTALLPGKQPSLFIGYEARWAPEPIWMLWKIEKSNPAVQPVARRYTDFAIPTPKFEAVICGNCSQRWELFIS
jgi:hypothetical protein